MAGVTAFPTTLFTLNTLADTGRATATTGTSGTFSAYSQLIASTSRISNSIGITVGATDGSGASGAQTVRFEVAVGGAGVEVTIAELDITFVQSSGGNTGASLLIRNVASSRISYRSTTTIATGALAVCSVSLV